MNLGQAVKLTQSGSVFQPKSGFERHPVVKLSWFGARAFARWMGGDLPTEAQWEKAAKGGREVSWPWGDAWDPTQANTAERLAKVREIASGVDWQKWWEKHYKTVIAI